MSASGRRYERGRGSNQNKRGPILGYRKLQQLSKANPSEIVEGLVHCRKSYKMLINSEEMKEDWIPLLIIALSKMCSSKMNQNVVELLQELQQSTFLSKHLPQYILQLHLIQEDVEDTHHFKAVLSSVCTFFKEWLARFPNSYFELPLDAFSGMLKRIIIVNTSDIDKEMDTLLTSRLEKIKRDRKCDKKDKEETEDKPPNNFEFRQIAVYPTKEEIRSKKGNFLRKNRIERGYDDLDDYLDVQFRLLREDFIAPLRTGIQEILFDAPKDERSQDLYIYHQVEIQEPLCMKSGIAHRVSFDITKLKGVPWEHSKRLMYGSFLCLSSDKFKTHLIFATVANRKHEDLRKGFIDIRFIQGQELLVRVSPGQKLSMVESPAYFESYRHVLARLQEINEKTYPFQKYLVNCVSDVDPPLYLREKNAQKATYDLRGALGVPYYEEAKQVSVLDFDTWPSANEVHETLNSSQMEALQSALSKEFAVIQGPPGTGKTYVGLKIVRALLDNREAWDAEGKSPLLMVCYTNHALDQFLEGVLEFTPSGIIRVGGQSSSEKLKDLNLHLFTRTSESRPQVLSDMRGCQEEIEKEKANLQRCKTRILQLSQLKGVIPGDHFYQLAYEEYKYKARKESVVEAWLGVRQFQEVKQRIAKSIREGEIQRDKTEENITVDVDAEVKERQLYQSMEEFLPAVKGAEHTQECEKSTSVHSTDLTGNIHINIPKGGCLNAMTDKEAKSEKFRKIWKMEKKEDRWRLYLFWLRCYQKRCEEKISQISKEYEKICQRLNEVEDNDRLKALKEATVIGMTTTGAAKYRTVLEQIQPKIVIVEEAAEVLEAHIIAALSQGTQHVILIGDHKQLKPNPTVYQLATKYNLDISLFERMVKNGMHCNLLTTQHRMRPEISVLMKHIYPDLQDHPTVCNYDNIRGVKHNIFFIDHQRPETENKELRSPSNKHEAEYIRELCRYLLLQGYSPQQITVLTTYTGQLLQLRKLMPRTVFEGVRVTAVDNFQGEENDIILLSLVRSNERGHVGFLKINNRVCVAISRARMGFYCIGNFKMLAKNSSLWSAVVKDMVKQHTIGNALELVCENHPDSKIWAETSADFKKAPEGGCTLPCDYRLDCGHVCQMVCHPIDPEHEEYTCRKKCLRLLCGDHETRCNKECHYGSPCGPCPVEMDKRIPSCGHTQIVLCGIPAEDFQCQEKCMKNLQCGHPCPTKCFVDCTFLECQEPFVRNLPCGHKLETTCSKQYDFVRCEVPCEVFLECLHPCPGNCSDCHQGRLHVPCQQPCQRDLVCQHQCDFPCTKNCPPCEKKCQNRCIHSKCPQKCKEICTPCKEPCGWRCYHYVCNRLCGELCAHVRCDKPCRKRLPTCGHPCIGLCGEKCPRLCRVCDKEEVTETFFGTEEEPDAIFIELIDCGHVIEVGAMDAYMKLDTDEEPSGEEGEEEDGRVTVDTQNIKLKGCPKCNTTINRSFRYGDIVNQMLHDISAVKQKILDEEKKMAQKCAKLKNSITTLSCSMHDCDFSCFKNWLQQRLSIDELTTIENQLQLLEEVYKTRSCAKKDLLNSTKHVSTEELYAKTTRAAKRDAAVEEINSELDQLETALRQFQISEQVLIDVKDEILRVRLLLRVRSFECDLAERSTSLSTSDQLRIADINSKLTRGNKISNSESEVLQDEINKLRIALGLGVLSKEERIMIVKAMGFSQGHWYKCPKGHIYAIGECGGAMQESTCPECKSKIGGTGHKLLAGNEVATEMDGAKHGAWSEQANLANYDPDMLRLELE